MAGIRRDENKREKWLVTNHTKFNMAVGDLLLLPVLKPGKTVDVLRYYSREKISHSTNLASLLKSGKFSLNKKKLFPNHNPGKIAPADVDDAITPAEENEAGSGGGGAETAAVLPLGIPTDGSYDDGLIQGWDEDTWTADAIDDLNETLSYLAPLDAVSMDGQALTTSGVLTYTGRLSDGNTNYPGGFGIGSTYTRIIKDGNFNILSPSPSTMFNRADEGELTYSINGVQNDTYDLASAFVEGLRSDVGGQIYPPDTGVAGNLRIDSVIWYNDFPKWQIGKATMFVVSGDLRQGYNYFDLKHVLDTDQDTDTLEFFYDTDAGSNPSITGTPDVVQNTKVSKWLSGIEYYYRGSTFDLDTVGADCFNNVYHQTSPLVYSSTSNTMGNGNIDYDDSSVSGVTDPPVIGETMTVANKLITIPNSNVRSIDSRATVIPRDPYGSYSSASSISEKRLVDAYLSTSTDIIEYFDDEDYRLPDNDGSAYPNNYDSIPGSITGVWTSSTVLSDGEAQVYNGGLFFPEINFTSGYLPTQQVGTNYSTFSGDQVYLRAIYDFGNTHNAGSLELQGLVNADVGAVGTGAINVEIRLPGVLPTATEWLDLGSTFFSGSFTGSQGDGCRTSQSGSTWGWTSGTFGTSNSGWMIIVRVTFRNSSKNITRIRELGW